MTSKDFSKVRGGYKGRVTVLMSEVNNASKERLTEIYHTVLAIQNQIKTLDQEVLFSQSDEKAVTKELELIEQYHYSIEAFIKIFLAK